MTEANRSNKLLGLASTDGLGAVFAARPIKWQRKHGQWEDDLYGFCLWQNKLYQRPYFVSWDAGLAAWMLRRKKTREAQFLTIESAQAWCQQQVDDWIRRHAVARWDDFEAAARPWLQAAIAASKPPNAGAKAPT